MSMSDNSELHTSTKLALRQGVFDDYGIDEILRYYAPELRPQQRAEVIDTMARAVLSAIDRAVLIAQGKPEDVMSIYNAGICEGFDRGFDQGRRVGCEQAMHETELQQGGE